MLLTQRVCGEAQCMCGEGGRGWTRLRPWRDVNYKQTTWVLVYRRESGCLFNGLFKSFLKEQWSCSGMFQWARLTRPCETRPRPDTREEQCRWRVGAGRREWSRDVTTLGEQKGEARDHAKVCSLCAYVIRSVIVTWKTNRTIYRRQLKIWI